MLRMPRETVEEIICEFECSTAGSEGEITEEQLATLDKFDRELFTMHPEVYARGYRYAKLFKEFHTKFDENFDAYADSRYKQLTVENMQPLCTRMLRDWSVNMEFSPEALKLLCEASEDFLTRRENIRLKSCRARPRCNVSVYTCKQRLSLEDLDDVMQPFEVAAINGISEEDAKNMLI